MIGGIVVVFVIEIVIEFVFFVLDLIVVIVFVFVYVLIVVIEFVFVFVIVGIEIVIEIEIDEIDCVFVIVVESVKRRILLLIKMKKMVVNFIFEIGFVFWFLWLFVCFFVLIRWKRRFGNKLRLRRGSKKLRFILWCRRR